MEYTIKNFSNFSKKYSEEDFWKKLNKFALKAGKEVVEKVLILFFALQQRDVPKWAKGVIIGALGYFIMPLDAIPDAIPFAGFSDDFGALAVALSLVMVHINDETREKASKKIQQWFGPEDR